MAEPALYLYAAGGHGRVILDALLASGVRVAGVVDAAYPIGQSFFDIPVVGGDDFLEHKVPGDVRLAMGLGLSPSIAYRQKAFEHYRARSFQFVSVRHPSAIVGSRCELLEGSQIMAGAVLQCGVQIGRNAVVNTRASVDHDCRIGDHAFVGPGAILCGGVHVGDGSLVGSGAVILPGIEIGTGCTIGAGAVANRAVPRGLSVAGNPARPLGEKTR